MMKIQSLLNPGDTLGVCAPSACFNIEKFYKGIHVLKKMGFKVSIPENIFEKTRYLAGDDQMRADIINMLFSDPDIKGIICARGGFGALRILDFLNWNSIRHNVKPFIGFSDNTAILLSIIQKTDNRVIHGPTVISLADAGQETLDSFYTVLTGCIDKINIKDPEIICHGKGVGVLKGGNMTTISHLSGTRFQPDFKDSVLFLEDIGEPAYKIDRMLTQMKMAGIFKGIKGVVTGLFKNCDHNEYIKEILSEIFDEYNVPVLSGLVSGHGRINLSLNMGMNIQLDTKTASIFWI